MATRLKNSKRNLVFGIFSTLLGVLTNFAVRTALLYALGAEYQGLNGLFNSILHVLNLTDLGFSIAITFILYKPVAENKVEQINAIANFLKKLYLIIGGVMFALGMFVMPFLPYLINGSYPLEINIYVLFVIYLLNSSISYVFFGYKSTLLSAMQREDIVSLVHIISTTILRVTQVVVLFVFKNYYVFVALVPVGSIINNTFIQILSKKYFPAIKASGKIDEESKHQFKKQVGSVFLGRLADITRNSFDGIFISFFLGLVAVAIYDNYFYIFSAIYGIMGVIIHSVQASVGNSIVTENTDKNYNDLLKFNFIFMTFVGFCTTCLFCLYQPFMRIWMKNNEEMLMSFENVVIVCAYFYLINMTYVRSMYLDGNGIFKDRRWLFVCEMVANIALNALLGYFFGMTGILLASTITILVFNYIGQNYVLFKKYFKRSIVEFYLHNLLYLFVTILVCGLVYLACYFVPFDGIPRFFILLLICVFVPPILYFCAYFKYKLFKPALLTAKQMILRRK